MKPMKIQQIFFKNTLRNFCYIITFSDGAIYCIDPFNASEVKDFLKEKTLTGILNTHDHCDHYSGNKELLERGAAPVFAHEKANIPGKTHSLKNGDMIYESNEYRLIALDTPGHTMSHMCFLLEKEQKPYALFTGDCFFNAGVGNCHNGGNPEVLYHTIANVFSAFPDDLLIYPGHEYLKRNLEFSQSVEEGNPEVEDFLKKVSKVNMDEVFFINNMRTERKINSFLRLKEPFIRAKLNLMNQSDRDVFIRLRELRNKW